LGWLTVAGGGVNGDSEHPWWWWWLVGAGAAAVSGEGASTNPKLPNQLHVSVHGGVGSVLEVTQGPAKPHRWLVCSHGGSVTLGAHGQSSTEARKG
jgi:hypothetical protein